jgi:hypothetical protein
VHSEVYYLVWESTEPQSVKNNERKREGKSTMTLKKQYNIQRIGYYLHTSSTVLRNEKSYLS